MAWVRIHDGAMTHPKIIGLSDKAFRLWIWGLSYSQQHLTNGLIPVVAIPARVVRATKDLVVAQLWDHGANCYQVHDYLDWNDSKADVVKKRTEAKDRMTLARERRSEARSQNVLERTNAHVLQRTSQEVLRRVGLRSSEIEEKEDPVFQRAADFLERYAALYEKHRHGAKLLRQKPAIDWDRACQLCRLWPDDRLDKMAEILLTTDEEWVTRTDRGFGIFFTKASWCDERLSAWEAEQAKKARA